MGARLFDDAEADRELRGDVAFEDRPTEIVDVGFRFDARQQTLQPLAPRVLAEVVESGRGRGLLDEAVDFEIAHQVPWVTPDRVTPDRWIARSSVPRYDAMTRVSSRTSPGVPSAITAPASRQ